MAHTPAHGDRDARTPTPARTWLLGGLFASTLAFAPSVHADGSPTDQPSLDLDRAVSLALANNPALALAGWDERAQAERATHAGAAKNPALGVELEDALGTGAFGGLDNAQLTLRLSQRLSLRDVRGVERRLAEVLRDRASAETRVLRTEIATATARQFIHVLADQERLGVARERAELCERVLASARERVRQGAASTSDEQRAAIARARARLAVEHAEHELAASRQRLAAQWGETRPSFGAVTGDLFARPAMRSLAELEGRVSEQPYMRRLDHDRSVRETERLVEEARRAPGLEVSVGGRRHEGLDAVGLVVGAALELPVFDNNAGPVAAARVREAQLADAERALAAQTAAELFGLYQELLHATTELDLLEREILPSAEAMEATVAQGVRVGRHNQLEWLDAQRTLVELRLERIEKAEELQRYHVAIEKLAGPSPRAEGRSHAAPGDPHE